MVDVNKKLQIEVVQPNIIKRDHHVSSIFNSTKEFTTNQVVTRKLRYKDPNVTRVYYVHLHVHEQQL